MVRGWIGNLAAEPFSNDTLMLKAIAAGQCDVGITNSYYLGRLQNEQKDFPVQIFWADQEGKGTHVNISGGGVTKYAKNRAEAVRFLEWLASPAIQQRFAAVNFEFPANAGVDPLPEVKAWGAFKPNTVNVGLIGKTQPAAVMLIDRAGWR
jgi:iron(III) transport system substrate-binding protein